MRVGTGLALSFFIGLALMVFVDRYAETKGEGTAMIAGIVIGLTTGLAIGLAIGLNIITGE